MKSNATLPNPPRRKYAQPADAQSINDADRPKTSLSSNRIAGSPRSSVAFSTLGAVRSLWSMISALVRTRQKLTTAYQMDAMSREYKTAKLGPDATKIRT